MNLINQISEEQVSASAVGKLFLAGEYAVTKPLGQALVAAVQSQVRVELSTPMFAAFPGQGRITSPGFLHSPVPYAVKDGTQLDADQQTSSRLEVLAATLSVLERYLNMVGQSFKAADILITSELQDGDKKYGLGSSGALTVALLRAFASWHRLDLTDLDVFKLAYLANKSHSPRASGADIATAVAGTTIFYRNPQLTLTPEFLASQRAFEQVFQASWQGLEICDATVAEDLTLKIFWTAQVASTNERLHTDIPVPQDLEHDFFQQSNQLVTELRGHLTSGSPLCLQTYAKSFELLANYTNIMKINWLTADLQLINQSARKHGGFAKPSGAGGGDCAVGIFTSPNQAWACERDLASNGIATLNFKILATNREDT